jgi:uncharacterized protein (TIRG00374 family)
VKLRTDERSLFPLKKTGTLVIAVGLFMFLLYLYFFVPFGSVISIVSQANPFYYSLAFAAMFLSGVFYSLTWQRLLHLLEVKSSFLKTLQFTWVGGFVDLLVPAESISGEICKVYLMSRERAENAGKVVASIIGHRILVMTVTLGTLVMSSVYFVIKYDPPMLIMEFVSVIGAATFVSLFLLFYLSRKPQATDKIVNWIIRILVKFSRGRWKFEGLKKSADNMLSAFHEGIDTLTVRPSRLVLPVSLALVSWLLDVLITVFVFFALNARVSFSTIVIVYSITAAIQNVPIGIPGEIGVLDVFMAVLYTSLGVNSVVSAVATVLIRVLTLGIRLLIGGLTVQWLGIKSFIAEKYVK